MSRLWLERISEASIITTENTPSLGSVKLSTPCVPLPPSGSHNPTCVYVSRESTAWSNVSNLPLETQIHVLLPGQQGSSVRQGLLYRANGNVAPEKRELHGPIHNGLESTDGSTRRDMKYIDGFHVACMCLVLYYAVKDPCRFANEVARSSKQMDIVQRPLANEGTYRGYAGQAPYSASVQPIDFSCADHQKRKREVEHQVDGSVKRTRYQPKSESIFWKALNSCGFRDGSGMTLSDGKLQEICFVGSQCLTVDQPQDHFQRNLQK